jgi:hypothetical protein
LRQFLELLEKVSWARDTAAVGIQHVAL